MTQSVPVIAIDGPGGAGKGTLGRMLVDQLGWHFLESGALYRCLAFCAAQQGIATEDEAQLQSLAANLAIQCRDQRVIIAGQDVTQLIRDEACGRFASQISQYASVRSALLKRQREFRQPPGLVADGRDMGTVVFPDAPLKIFLTASSDERAKRRCLQLQQQGINVSLSNILREIKARDARDEQRAVAPLKAAPDAVHIDATALTIEQVFSQVMALYDAHITKR